MLKDILNFVKVAGIFEINETNLFLKRAQNKITNLPYSLQLGSPLYPPYPIQGTIIQLGWTIQLYCSLVIRTRYRNSASNPLIIQLQRRFEFLWYHAVYFFLKSITNSLEALVSSETTVAANVDDGFIGDLIPSQLNRTFFQREGRSVVIVEVLFESTDHSVVEGRHKESSFSR